MKKVLITILIIGFSTLAVKIGDLILRYTNDDYRAKKQIETWNARLAEMEEEDCQLVDLLNPDASIKEKLK